MLANPTMALLDTFPIRENQARDSFASRLADATARKGTAAFTVVPWPGWLSNSNVPSNWSTRSRILISPSPPTFRSGQERNPRHHRTQKAKRGRWTA